MRIHLPASLLALACLAAPAQSADRNFGITSFERIRVEGPFTVRLTTGVAPFARASGSTAALDRVQVEMVGQTLVVHNNQSSFGGYSDTQDAGPVEIQVGTHDLSSAVLTGSGSLQIDGVKGLTFDASAQGSGMLTIAAADVDQLNVNMIGTPSAFVSGRAASLHLAARGVSSFDGSALTTRDAVIGAEGSSTIKAIVTNSAKIEGSGPATVSLTGGPSCTARLSGAASVSGCRASQ